MVFGRVRPRQFVHERNGRCRDFPGAENGHGKSVPSPRSRPERRAATSSRVVRKHGRRPILAPDLPTADPVEMLERLDAGECASARRSQVDAMECRPLGRRDRIAKVDLHKTVRGTSISTLHAGVYRVQKSLTFFPRGGKRGCGLVTRRPIPRLGADRIVNCDCCNGQAPRTCVEVFLPGWGRLP